MKILLVIIGIVCSTSLYAQRHLNVISFNIRLNTSRDSLDAWPYRKDLVVGQILFHEAHIIGVQEALPDQLEDMQIRLPAYKYVGVGREPGNKGEASSIFYDTTRLKVFRSSTFWLSPTPDVPGSKGWDAALPRIVSWAEFWDRRTKKKFFVFNTHFDHVGSIARKESARLLLQKVNDIAGSKPTIITGDLNAKPTDEPIQMLTDSTGSLHFVDAKNISATSHYGPDWTFNGFKIKTTDGDRIDYIFKRNNVAVLQHATLSQIWNSRFASDHFAVFARVIVQ